MKLYVGNLSYNTSEDDLRTAFGAFGTVASVTIVKDKFTGESKGFGFVEMEDPAEAKSAIAGMGGKEVHGRQLKVDEARPREDRGGRGGGGGGGRRGGGRDRRW